MSSAGSIGNIGTTISDFGGAISDLFGAQGSSDAASAYGTAAGIAKQNAALTARSTAISEQQQGISTFKVLGSEQADTAGAGFTSGGSAAYLMRASASQASLSKQLIENQGQITEEGYQQQAAAYTGQQKAAETQSEGQAAGGILGAVSGISSLFSLF